MFFIRDIINLKDFKGIKTKIVSGNKNYMEKLIHNNKKYLKYILGIYEEIDDLKQGVSIT